MGQGKGRRARRTLVVLPAALLGAIAALPATAGAAGETQIAIPRRIAYVTSSLAKPQPQVWAALGNGSEPRLLGPGSSPLLAPNGALVAAALFGAEHGPSLALYTVAGAAPLRVGDLAVQTAMPLAWSPDSRYLAVSLVSTAVKNVAKSSGLGILDTTTGTLTRIATGIVYGASFAPDGSDRVVFGRAGSQSGSAAVDLYVAAAGGGRLVRLTRDGRSLNPVWGGAGIAYDRERLRRNDAPVYQIWLRRTRGGAPRRLTSIRVRSLVSGLVPLGFSRDGTRLLAEFVGQDTSEAWTVRVPSGRARPVRVRGRPVVGGAISSDGARLLVYEGGQEGPASGDAVVTVPFGGGRPTRLVARAAQPSWNE